MSNVPCKTISGRCYCGSITFWCASKPQVVAYCHCSDCRRATGGPVAAFAAFAEGEITFAPNEGQSVCVTAGVTRTFCGQCGSSLTGRYDYLPGQVYVSLGVIDQANDLAPDLHSHDAQRLKWLHIVDDKDRAQTSATQHLNAPFAP
ncbi:MAG: GFA family protein [Sedimentitalea sp.]